MGYEIAGGLGAKMASPDRDVFVMVGDGSYLMLAQELVTVVAEHIELIVVLVQNHGFASIGEPVRVAGFRSASERGTATATPRLTTGRRRPAGRPRCERRKPRCVRVLCQRPSQS